MIDAHSGGAPVQAPRWDLVGTEGCGGGIRFLAPVLIVWGYVGIYRRKKYVGGATGGPRGWRARLDHFLACTPSLDHVRSKNHAPEGFIPFGLRLIFIFLETLK